MRCAACNRPMLRPALVLGGVLLGPVCARKVLDAASQLDGAARARRERRQADTDVVRDDRTPDLFAEVAL